MQTGVALWALTGGHDALRQRPQGVHAILVRVAAWGGGQDRPPR